MKTSPVPAVGASDCAAAAGSRRTAASWMVQEPAGTRRAHSFQEWAASAYLLAANRSRACFRATAGADPRGPRVDAEPPAVADGAAGAISSTGTGADSLGAPGGLFERDAGSD